jgi:hypothetical protein
MKKLPVDSCQFLKELNGRLESATNETLSTVN